MAQGMFAQIKSALGMDGGAKRKRKPKKTVKKTTKPRKVVRKSKSKK